MGSGDGNDVGGKWHLMLFVIDYNGLNWWLISW